MISMRERLARSIQAEYCRRMIAAFGAENIKPAAWDDLVESSRNDYRKTADAVFIELRKPTHEILAAGAGAIIDAKDSSYDTTSISEKIWQAMIDEASKVWQVIIDEAAKP